MPTEAYRKIRPGLDTGDLVLFSGRGLTSALIQAGQLLTHGADCARWTHVGMVYKPIDDLVLLWESTTLTDLEDMDTGTPTKGVQLVPLSHRVATYQGDIAIRTLEVERTGPMRKRMDELRHELRGRPYEKRKVDLFMSAVAESGGEEDLSSIFCSELLAESWQAWDLIHQERPSDRWCPADFAALRTLERGELGSIRPIKTQPKPKTRHRSMRPRR